jgi:hypothetical protein
MAISKAVDESIIMRGVRLAMGESIIMRGVRIVRLAHF